MNHNFVKGTVVALGLALSVGACTSPGKRTAIGAGGGAAAGAAIGGLTGGWKGAAIGAGVGAATGAAVGNYLDKQYKELEQVADTKRLKDAVLVKMKNDLLFATGSSTLKESAVNDLNEVGKILAKYKDDRIRVAGHTDNTGSDSFNAQLSERRADAVRQVLRDQGVKDDQIAIQGFGETHPIANNSTEKGRQLNRRVELIIDVPADKVREPASTN